MPQSRQNKEAVPFLRYRSLKRPRGASSGQASLRHPKVTAYRCFLPDLTGFTASRRARPSHQRRLPRSSLQRTRTSRKAFDPAIADCGCRAPLVPRLARPHVLMLRNTKPKRQAEFRVHIAKTTLPPIRARWKSRWTNPLSYSSIMPGGKLQFGSKAACWCLSIE